MIQGTITLKNGTEIEINDDVLVRDGLSFSMSTSTGGRFDIGTFNAAELKISIYDEEAAGHEFDAAIISLSETDESGENTSKLGTYYVDGTKTDRRNKLVKLVAYDAATRFDVEIEDKYRKNSGGAAMEYNIIGIIITACLTVTGAMPLFLEPTENFPNNSVTGLTLQSEQIQTWRDAVMWAAQLLCANAVINRDGRLEIRRAKYFASGESIQADHEIDGDQRISIRFSDIRTYIKYLTAYEAKQKVVNYTSNYTASDAQARPAEFALPENPILRQKTEQEIRKMNTDWLTYIDGFKQREIKAELFGNPKIQLGNTCRFSGGTIDVRRSIIGVVTDIRIKYNGVTTIICRAPAAVVSEGG